MSELFRTTSEEMQRHLIKLAMEAGASEHSLAEIVVCQSKVAQQQLLREFAPFVFRNTLLSLPFLLPLSLFSPA